MRAWLIVIKCHEQEMGDPIPATMWDVLSRLAAVREVMPVGWSAEAYPKAS